MSLVLLFLLAAKTPTTLLEPPFRHTLGLDRVTRFMAERYLGSGFISNPQGLCGAKMIEEDDPSTGRDDHILALFAVNSGTGQIVYNVGLRDFRVFGSQGSDEGQFLNPSGICCNPAGDIYVADTDNDRVARLLYASGELKWVSVLDQGLSSPHDVALDSRGRLYIADTENDRIVVCDPGGGTDAEWTGELDRPTALAVLDRKSSYNDYGVDRAVVIDHDRTRVNLVSMSGQLLRRVDTRRIGLDEASFAYCAFDRHGNIYVTDRSNSQIHVFDSDLKYIVSHGEEGEFESPRGIAIWPRFGQVFVLGGAGVVFTYRWIALDGYLIGCYPWSFDSRRPGTTIALYVTEVADVTITIQDGSGRPVRTLTPPHHQRPGEVLIVWDGRGDDGGLVDVGQYEIEAVVRPTYSRPGRTFRKVISAQVERLPDT